MEWVPNVQSTGRAGEFLAAYILEAHGVECHRVDRQGADLWCKRGDKITTVQVKTASESVVDGNRAVYRYNTKTRDAAWFCFVALDTRLVLLRPAENVLTISTRIHQSTFTPANQGESVQHFISTLLSK